MRKPSKDEYAPYYEKYIDAVLDKNPLALMLEQLTEVEKIFAGISDSKAEKTYAEGKWSVKELFGHINDTERIMSSRALSIARGEKKPLPGYDQDEYVLEGNFNGRTIKSLVDEFIKLRESNIILFGTFDEKSFEKKGNADGKNVSVRALMFIIAGHVKHHLSILKERYLPVLN